MNVNKSIDVVISANSLPLAGQRNASLIQSNTPIDITNKINPEWSESLAGTKTWSINCSGVYVVDAESLKQLEQAFLEDKELTVSFTLAGDKYYGQALLTDFPLNTVFNQGLRYSAKLLGTGSLTRGE